MAEILKHWEVKRSLLLAGGSTALAMNEPVREQSWTIQFGSGKNVREVNLRQNSFSGSGLAVKGEHIVDPQSGNPVTAQKRAWALSDALSTTFIILDRPAMESFCEKHDGVGWALELSDDHDGVTAISRLQLL